MVLTTYHFHSFYKWKASAEKNDSALPFFSKWDGKGMDFKAASPDEEMSQETSFTVVDDGEHVDGRQVGTYGILKSYTQASPVEKFPPVNYNMYKPLLTLDQAFRHDAPGNEIDEGNANGNAVAVGMAATVFGTASVGVAVAQSMELLDNLHFY